MSVVAKYYFLPERKHAYFMVVWYKHIFQIGYNVCNCVFVHVKVISDALRQPHSSTEVLQQRVIVRLFGESHDRGYLAYKSLKLWPPRNVMHSVTISVDFGCASFIHILLSLSPSGMANKIQFFMHWFSILLSHFLSWFIASFARVREHSQIFKCSNITPAFCHASWTCIRLNGLPLESVCTFICCHHWTCKFNQFSSVVW